MSGEVDASRGNEGAHSVVVDRLHDDVVLPSRATAGSAGFDLRAHLRARTVRCSDTQAQYERAATEENGEWGIDLAPREMALIPLGFKARIPVGIEAQIRPRSGTSFKKGLQIPNAPGTIDSDYPDEWMVIVRNPTPTPIRIEHGERVAQMVLARYEVLPIESGTVTISTSRIGGFGSTGQ